LYEFAVANGLLLAVRYQYYATSGSDI